LNALELAQRLEAEARSIFGVMPLTALRQRQGRKGATLAIKQAFGSLGQSLEFEVASDYLGADEGEWLYDMVWYEVRSGFMLRQAVVLESELKPESHVDGDFHKLVQARADVRVWISLANDASLAVDHVRDCKTQIGRFAGSVSGDLYLLIVDNWTTPNTSIELFTHQ
jgi:hypothetical protein